MTNTKLLSLAMVSVITAGTLGLAGSAYAEKDQRTNEAAIMANAKFSMAQAIAAAEKQVGGKAVGSGIEDQDGTVFLEVQVLKDDQKHKVLVDPQTGSVVKTVMEDDENENGHESENENGHESDDD